LSPIIPIIHSSAYLTYQIMLPVIEFLSVLTFRITFNILKFTVDLYSSLNPLFSIPGLTFDINLFLDEISEVTKVSNSFRYMFDKIGDTIPPCGTPLNVL